MASRPAWLGCAFGSKQYSLLLSVPFRVPVLYVYWRYPSEISRAEVTWKEDPATRLEHAITHFESMVSLYAPADRPNTPALRTNFGDAVDRIYRKEYVLFCGLNLLGASSKP